MDKEQKVLLLTALAVSVFTIKRQTQRLKRKRYRRMWVRDIYVQRKKQGFYDNLIKEMRISSPELFFNFARMSAGSFEYLLSLCCPHLKKYSPRESIRPEIRLMVTLRFLATGDSYPSLGYAFRIAPSTICNIIFEVCNLLWTLLSPIYLKALSERQWLQIANDFYNIWQMPNCLGSIDGKHIKIQAPSHSGSVFFNYKKYFSIILLAICDAKYFFTYVNIGSYGAQSDGGVLKNSDFGRRLQEGTLGIPLSKELPLTSIKVPFYFVGDEAFPLQINLIRPYSKARQNRLPEDKLIFNYRLSRARRTIENAFGVMVARFRIYHKTILAEPVTVDAIVKATICLHNFIKHRKGDSTMYAGVGFADYESDNGVVLPGQWRREVPESNALGSSNVRFGNRNYTREAFNLRDYLNNYFNNIGSVPWQIDYVRRTS